MKKMGIDAKRILSEVQPEKAFWINNGPVLKSLGEFAQAAKKLSPSQFAHHASQQRNDFAKWVDEVIGDSTLAKRLRALKSPEAVSKAVGMRVEALKKLAK